MQTGDKRTRAAWVTTPGRPQIRRHLSPGHEAGPYLYFPQLAQKVVGEAVHNSPMAMVELDMGPETLVL